jgi:hypothetical protein
LRIDERVGLDESGLVDGNTYIRACFGDPTWGFVAAALALEPFEKEAHEVVEGNQPPDEEGMKHKDKLVHQLAKFIN